jgi:hypothetical protein
MLYNCHINIEICSSIKQCNISIIIYTNIPIEHLTQLSSLIMVIRLLLIRLSGSGMPDVLLKKQRTCYIMSEIIVIT